MKTLIGALILAAVASFAAPSPAMASNEPAAAFLKAGDNDGDKDGQKGRRHHRHHRKHHHKRHHKNPNSTTTTNS